MPKNKSDKAFNMGFYLNRLKGSMHTSDEEGYMMDSVGLARSGVKCTWSSVWLLTFDVKPARKGYLIAVGASELRGVLRIRYKMTGIQFSLDCYASI